MALTDSRTVYLDVSNGVTGQPGPSRTDPPRTQDQAVTVAEYLDLATSLG